MSIIRIKKEREYVSIANAILQNKNLSWEARGIMAYLLSKPDGWECRNYDLVNQGPSGKHIIQRVLKELKEAGYIHRYQKSNGRKIEWVTEIYETPELNTASRNTDILPTEEPTGRKAAVRESGDIVSTDSQKVLILESTDFDGSSKKSLSALVDPSRSDNLNAIADQIAQICGNINLVTAHLDTKEEIKRVTLSLYEINATQDNLKDFAPWWYDNTWQGKKGQAPTPKQLGDKWGQFEAQKVINVPITTDGGFYI